MKKNISRRDGLKLGIAMGVSAFTGTSIAADKKSYSKISESAGREIWDDIHGGKGSVPTKRFGFDGAMQPANFLTYDFPPGASEGIHTHILNDENAGSFDEFYYVVSGVGQMEIDGEIVPIKEGDHVFTPIGVSHGIENTSEKENLKVFLTFILR